MSSTTTTTTDANAERKIGRRVLAIVASSREPKNINGIAGLLVKEFGKLAWDGYRSKLLSGKCPGLALIADMILLTGSVSTSAVAVASRSSKTAPTAAKTEMLSTAASAAAQASFLPIDESYLRPLLASLKQEVEGYSTFRSFSQAWKGISFHKDLGYSTLTKVICVHLCVVERCHLLHTHQLVAVDGGIR